MPFIGNKPALSYTSFAKQDFTTSATTSYTLDHKVANENELALFINFVRQEAGTAYTASNNTLTLSSATSSSDDMYAIFLGQAIQTVNPPNASVGASQIVDASITSGKLASGVLPANTPAFLYTASSNQSIANATNVVFDVPTKIVDTDDAYDTTNKRFVIPSGKDGLYCFFIAYNYNGTATSNHSIIQRRDSSDNLYQNSGTNIDGGYNLNQNISGISFTMYYNCVAGDRISASTQQHSGSTQTLYYPRTFFGGYKLIGA